MKTKFLLSCFVFALCVNIHTVNAQVKVQDSLALVDLYNSTGGSNWKNHTNWLTASPVSTWYGIEVKGTRVTAILLYQNNLVGSFPASVVDLVNLQYLSLYYNHLSGSIPPSIGNLINLRQLTLNRNSLRGGIPSSISNLINLGRLDLSENQLSGGIPSSLGNLVNLHWLSLSYNQLSGSIPSSIGNLINLGTLDLRDNQLSGNIPSSIGNLTNLIDLILRNNQLSGSIPSSIGNLGSLNGLYLDNNKLSGSIPSSIGNLTIWYILDLSNNRLSGSIPSSIGKLTSIRIALDLSNNRLSGHIPSSLRNLDYPGEVNLSHNYLTFDGLEELIHIIRYDHQKNIPIHQNGNTLSVSAGGTLSNNTYKLLKWESRTTYTLVATNQGDSVFHPTVSGIYQVKILNSIATELVLYSKVIRYVAPANSVIASSENNLQHGKANVFRVYPNPAKDILHVETNGAAMFSLIDQSGKILVTTNINGKGSINVSGITSGLYYLKNNSTGSVQKVVIER